MKGFKKEIWVTFFIVAALGVFFQLNRMDAFLHLNPWSNNAPMGAAEGEDAYAGLPREKCLVIYDAGEVQSVLRRHMQRTAFHVPQWHRLPESAAEGKWQGCL